jgi:hypothetical protein
MAGAKATSPGRLGEPKLAEIGVYEQAYEYGIL